MRADDDDAIEMRRGLTACRLAATLLLAVAAGGCGARGEWVSAQHTA